jgi:hypothetical protein
MNENPFDLASRDLQEEEELMRCSQLTVTPLKKFGSLASVVACTGTIVSRAVGGCRNPLFYLPTDLRDYAAALGKPMLVMVQG